MGPREIERLWERHLVNSGALASVLPARGLIMDVGSGAGLPGLVLALQRPDLSFELVDSMKRRTDWLTEASAALDLKNVTVTRARAEDLGDRADAAAVVSRAVARLDKLAQWTAGLLAPDGLFLALKGASAAEELAESRGVLLKAGLTNAEVIELRPIAGIEPVRVVKARKRPDQSPKAQPGQEKRFT
jgi:16S rRNA (guanine527-N7)-methyltransferase